MSNTFQYPFSQSFYGMCISILASIGPNYKITLAHGAPIVGCGLPSHVLGNNHCLSGLCSVVLLIAI